LQESKPASSKRASEQEQASEQASKSKQANKQASKQAKHKVVRKFICFSQKQMKRNQNKSRLLQSPFAIWACNCPSPQ
jgi:hypothetical protein